MHITFSLWSVWDNKISEDGAQLPFHIKKKQWGHSIRVWPPQKLHTRRFKYSQFMKSQNTGFLEFTCKRTAFICSCCVFSFFLFFLVALWWPFFQICIPAFVQLALKSLSQPCVIIILLKIPYSLCHSPHVLFFLLLLSNQFIVLLSFNVAELLSFNLWNLTQWLPVLLSPFICGSQLSSLCLAGRFLSYLTF